MLLAKPFTEEHAKLLCAWHYPGEYAVYDFPPWEDVCRLGWALAVPAKRDAEFSAVCDETGRFVGFFRRAADGRVALGLAPEVCGRGLGAELMALIKRECPRRPLVLEVRTFNRRAVRCYERAGFATVGITVADNGQGPREMYKMMLW